MKIAMLARNPQLYSHRRMVEAAAERGHHIDIVNTLDCYVNVEARNPTIKYRGRALDGYDAVIPRIGASITFYGLAVLRQFEMMGVWSLNESVAIGRSRDKLRALQILSRAGVGLPTTCFAHASKYAEDMIGIVGGAPVVVKLLEGTQGVGVILSETVKSAKSVIEAFRTADVNILVQEYVKESEGTDIRAFVIGNQVVGAMMRKGAPGEFRSNLHRGGKAQAVKITAEERKTALKAAKALGLNVAGVDMLRSDHGPLVIEVNSSPGLEGIEHATKIDIAGRIIDFIAANAEAHDTKTRGTG